MPISRGMTAHDPSVIAWWLEVARWQVKLRIDSLWQFLITSWLPLSKCKRDQAEVSTRKV